MGSHDGSENNIDPVRMRPVPLEFALYFDC